MNDVIISLGGVEKITHTIPLDASDIEIQSHLSRNVYGTSIPTLAQVKAQIPVYLAQVKAGIFSETVSTFESAVQNHLDTGAKTLGYDGVLSACSYVTSSNLKFSTEAQSFVLWRDSVWSYCYQELAMVQQGIRPLPTVAEIIYELPLRT